MGVRVPTVVSAQRRAGQFWCKGYELQQVVDESRGSFKSFFRWLQNSMLTLDDSLVDDLVRTFFSLNLGTCDKVYL